MGKRKQEDEEEDGGESISKEQLDAFELKAGEYESEDALLVGLRAVRFRDGQMIVLKYDYLAGTKDPITGLTFKNDVPYTFYTHLVEELKKRDRQRDYAKLKSAEAVEASADYRELENF